MKGVRKRKKDKRKALRAMIATDGNLAGHPENRKAHIDGSAI